MKHGFYTKLAFDNIRKNRRIYIPYILTGIFTVMMYYLVTSLSQNPGLNNMYGGNHVAFTLNFGTYIIGIFALIFLFYTNSFLMKRRQKEFGIFNILGMEKKHLAVVILAESAIVTFASLAAGLLLGMVFDKVMFLLICKVIDVRISLGFFISKKVILNTVLLFGMIYLLIYLKAVFTIRIANPIELLRGGNVGEKEPRAKWLLALLGAIFLGIGYGLALTIRDPIASIEVFFVAVILVIAATYLLFTAGSIVILKLLRKNQKFYYQPEHFISLSGMMYRMKQNAAGLANICILSTMVLVMLSTTTSLIIGIEDIIRTRYPNDFGIYADETKEQKRTALFQEIDELCRENEITVQDKTEYRYALITACERGNEFETDESKIDVVKEHSKLRALVFLPLSDYNASSGECRKLAGNETLFFSKRQRYEEQQVKLLGQEYEIAEQLDQFFGNGVSEANIATTYYLVVSDEAFERLIEDGLKELGEYCNVKSYYGFDTSADEKQQKVLADQIGEKISSAEFNGYMETRLGSREDFLNIYGGLFFLGIFLGALFIMATVMIIYYKQISEGYEDRERFAIMQKVGMTQAEVKQTIRSQVLTVFFLPLIVAAIHVAVAFPLIRLLMALLNMVNVKLYLICTVIAFLIFAVLYVIIYGLTARTYYKIVRWN
ncbi:MAG: ABC transporter permease [Eubacteriales bacterium]|nr:ABC transporter permease [Eubacteriales bacterium]